MPAQGRGISGFGLALAASGGILLYSGARGKSVSSVALEFLRGGNPAQALNINTTGTGSSSLPPAVGKGGNPEQNQALAKLMTGAFGWSSGAEWSALVSLWNQESGWSQYADTRKSGLDPQDATVFAYGIAQARPYSKYPLPGWPSDKGGISNPAVQIAWGLGYIRVRYGDPVAAWAHEQANGWY